MFSSFKLVQIITAGVLAAASCGAALAAVEPGSVAPDFTMKDTSGKERKLSEFRGKTIVLEWNNPNCPFVMKHYTSRNMQGLQADAAKREVVWLAVNSTNPAHNDYMKPADLVKWKADQKSTPTAYLMDESGAVGKAYGARTTPHMWVIGKDGKVVFAGGIDDRRSANPADVAGARNHVRAALDETLAGRPVSVASAQPYGCSVKY